MILIVFSTEAIDVLGEVSSFLWKTGLVRINDAVTGVPVDFM